MTKGYRIAIDVPWDADKSPDWGSRFPSSGKAVDALMPRLSKHKGDGFKIRARGEDWGPKRSFREVDDRILAQINGKKFHVGDMLIVWALSDDVRFLVREVDLPDPSTSMNTVGDDDVDFNHGLIFGDPQFNDVESWGIRNDRYISGSNPPQPSQHWARKDSSGSPCEARAEDFGGASGEKMWAVARKIANGGHCGKILYAGSEWLPEWDGFRFIGSYIGHYDHVHAESRDVTGTLC